MTSYTHLGTSTAKALARHPLHVFCADDDEDDRVFFCDALQDQKDIEVSVYASGLELVKALHHRTPDPTLVFLDINMPGMNGFDVLEHLADMRQMGCVRIIMLTTGADSTSIDRCRHLGADYFIEKPSSFHELQKALLFGLSIDWELFPRTEDSFLHPRVMMSFWR